MNNIGAFIDKMRNTMYQEMLLMGFDEENDFLDLSNQDLSIFDTDELILFLESLTVYRLSMENTKLDQIPLAERKRILESIPASVEVLYLGYNAMFKREEECFLANIRAGKSVLSLDGCNIGEEPVEVVTKLMHHLPKHTKSLSLANNHLNNFTPVQLKTIFERFLPNLKILNLVDNFRKQLSTYLAKILPASLQFLIVNRITQAEDMISVKILRKENAKQLYSNVTQISEQYQKYNLKHGFFSIIHRHGEYGRERAAKFTNKIRFHDYHDMQKDIIKYLVDKDHDNGNTHPHSFRTMLLQKLLSTELQQSIPLDVLSTHYKKNLVKLSESWGLSELTTPSYSSLVKP